MGGVKGDRAGHQARTGGLWEKGEGEGRRGRFCPPARFLSAQALLGFAAVWVRIQEGAAAAAALLRTLP